METCKPDLKPCPFCGGQAILFVHTFHKLNDSYSVGCSKCQAHTYSFYDTIGTAIDAWNRRANDDTRTMEKGE